MRIKKRTFSGCVCEQEIYALPNRTRSVKNLNKKLRFETEEQREQHKEGISRRHFIRLINENFNPQSLYSTLTFDNSNEVHTFEEARQIRKNYVRRLKYHFPDAVIVVVMGRGKNTKRIHFHMVSHGIPEGFIKSSWIYGNVVDVENLRERNYYNDIDYGQDYTGLANYLFDHWTKEQGGHRYYITRNARKPQTEEVTEVKREYSEFKPPIAPRGYELREVRTTQYGYMYFKYVKITDEMKRQAENSAEQLRLYYSLVNE